MVIVVSDFDLKGSGYMQIAVSLCNELVTKHGRKVTALGIAYDSSEHNWPFQILPVNQAEMLREIPTMIYNFKEMGANGQWDPIEAIVVALDVPVQEKLLQIDRGSIPYIGIFPVESGPLCKSWADSLSLMTQRLVISEFGTRMVEDAGVSAVYMPIGIDTASWRAPGVEERKAIRQSLGFGEDDYVVLTVADNQERKNLSVAMDIMARSRKKINAKWMLVTRLQCPVGWKLNDLSAYYGMTDHFVAFDRGLPFDRLWILYAAADAFLLTSKAEGLCLPVLESMATETPVLALNTTAIPEHIYADPDWSRLSEGQWGKGHPRGRRGFEIPVEFVTMDPWGNSFRSFANAKEGTKALVKLANTKSGKLEAVLSAGRAYAEARTWQKAGDVLAEAVRTGIALTAPPPAEVAPTGLPASAPRPLPPMYTIPDTGGIEDV